MSIARFAPLVFVAGIVNCAPEQPPLAARPGSVDELAISSEVRHARAVLIRDSAGAKGVRNGVLFAGIGQAETGLAHCDSEVGYGCPGPGSPSCGGAAILAGGADGPCSDHQGGLGMFQFDSGTYDQTLATYGDLVLTIEGNTGFAVEFMIQRIINSVHVDNVSTREEAIAFMNSVEVGGANWDAWLTSVTHYYNGCSPSGCSVFDSRYAHYRDSTIYVRDEFGPEFWADVGDLPPPPACEAIPAEGRVIEEDDNCAVAGGPSQYWRHEQDGSGGALLWTHTTDDADAANYAVWNLDLASAGRYELAVYTDTSFAQSQLARYVVTHAGATTTVVVDQAASDGWRSLGVFDFAAGGGQHVRVDDNTGEPLSGNVQLVFDALRVTPEVTDPPVDPPPDDPPADDDAPADDDPPDDPPPPDDPLGDPSDDPSPSQDARVRAPHVVATSGCAASSPSGTAVAIVALSWVRRRRTRE